MGAVVLGCRAHYAAALLELQALRPGRCCSRCTCSRSFLLALRPQLDQQAHDLHGAQARAAAAEEGQQKAQLDVACLKRGLELAAEQLTRSAGAEVPGTLLRAVARVRGAGTCLPAAIVAEPAAAFVLHFLASCCAQPAALSHLRLAAAAAQGQEEALGLSLQLSDAKQQAAALAAALEQAREHLQAQQTALTQQQGERQELLQRAEGAEAALEKQRAATAELRRVLDALRWAAGNC